MLNFNEFQEHIKNTILDYLPEEFSDAKVDLQQVAKNNEMLTGIIIHQEKINISPTIYLDPFYKDYLSGSKDLDTVMGEIGQIYVQNVPDKNFDVSAVALQDRLSDHVYKYDFARHEIYRADQEQQRQAELNAEQARTHATGR